MNTVWWNDPCCNWEMRQLQCCAPRKVQLEETVITNVDQTQISKYAAAMGPNGVSVALSVALAYMDMERKAASECT